MFNGAADYETAIGEVSSPAPTRSVQVTWGAFETSRDCRVVDFTRLPPVPSIFDPKIGGSYHEVRFLHAFVDQLSSKSRAGWEAVDYVPTQVLTEFFLRVHGGTDRVEGLIYKSTVNGGEAIVLDVPNERCVEHRAMWQDDPMGALLLGLVPDSVSSRVLP
jgi:hypothetical protein